MKNFIADKRRILGLSQRSLADMLGIQYQSLQKWEKGSVIPSVDYALRLALILHTTVEELFTLDDSLPTNPQP